MPDLNHAACLVTGAASGIGRDFVCMLAQQYEHVKFTLVDVDERGCKETVRCWLHTTMNCRPITHPTTHRCLSPSIEPADPKPQKS